jgi:hypothetical protein
LRLDDLKTVVTFPMLSKGAHIALSALREAIAVEGEQPPPSDHIPEGIRAVSMHTWRAYAHWWAISTGGARATNQTRGEMEWVWEALLPLTV